MVSIKIDQNLLEPFRQIAETESRSQGGQVEFWIKKEAERLKIKIPVQKQEDSETAK